MARRVRNRFCCAPVCRVLPPGARGRKNRFCCYLCTVWYRSMPLAGEEPLLLRASVQHAIAWCPEGRKKTASDARRCAARYRPVPDGRKNRFYCVLVYNMLLPGAPKDGRTAFTAHRCVACYRPVSPASKGIASTAPVYRPCPEGRKNRFYCALVYSMLSPGFSDGQRNRFYCSGVSPVPRRTEGHFCSA